LHFSALDTFIQVESPIHHLDARVKVVVTLILIVAVVLVPDGRWVTFAVFQVLLVAVAALARIGLGSYVKRSAVALPFALAALTVVFSTPGEVLVQWWPLGYPLAVTSAGLVRFGSIVVRSLLSVQGAVLLAGTTEFPDILLALRWLHVPSVLVAVAGFLYRYLFVLADEAQRMMRAREARSATRSGKGGGSLLWRARVTGGMAGSLFIRSYERSERIYDAMLARGYDGEVRALEQRSLARADFVVGVCASMLVLSLAMVTRLVTRP
jgi:cobalt/nickel transport system permease protein